MEQTEKSKYNIWIIIGGLGVILLCIVLNTLFFQKTLNKMVSMDLYNNSHSVAEQISNHIESKTEAMIDFADTLSRMPEQIVTEDFLYRKSKAYDMDELAVFEKNGQRLNYMGNGAELEAFVEDEWENLSEPRITFLDSGTLVFSAPVLMNEGLQKVVVGKKAYTPYSAHYFENALVGLVDAETYQVLVYQNGANSSIKRENGQVLWRQALENPGELMQDGKYIVSDEKIDNTSWIYVSMIYYDDVIPVFSRHIRIYMILAVFELCILFAGLYQFKKQVDRQEQVFLTDSLTGGLNRAGFVQESKELLERYNRFSYYIVRINIVDFRYINDSWGENAGNRTLKFVYRMLKEGLNEKEQLCRINVDHFLLLLHESDDEAVSRRITESIKRINDYVHYNFSSYNMDFLVGACRFSYGQDVTEVIRNAIYVSKMSKIRNTCVFYDEEMMEQIASVHELDESFYDSLRNREFKIYFQPKVKRDGTYEAEALVRWAHPKKGLIFPGQFISLFEQNGKIMDLDIYVFEELCRIVSQWMKEKKPVSPISVNVSRYSLLNAGEGIYKEYGAIKEKYGVPDGILEIELTETALMDGNQMSFVRGVLDGFRSYGFRVALDDFGFAYSSLGLLKNLEVDTIKIDRTFFVDVNHKSEKIVCSMIQLIHSLNMNVVAEGIEQEDQLEQLYKDGCDYVQGYVYSKAISEEEFEDWREKQGSGK